MPREIAEKTTHRADPERHQAHVEQIAMDLVRPFTRTEVVEPVREVGGVRIAHALVMEAGEI